MSCWRLHEVGDFSGCCNLRPVRNYSQVLAGMRAVRQVCLSIRILQ